MGNLIPKLTGSVVFSDWSGVLAYTRFRPDNKKNEYGLIELDNNNFYVSLGTTLDQSRMFLGVYGSTNVTDLNQGSIFEIIP